MNTLVRRVARNTFLIATGLAAVGYTIQFALEREDWLALLRGTPDERRNYARRILSDEFTPYSPGLRALAEWTVNNADLASGRAFYDLRGNLQRVA